MQRKLLIGSLALNVILVALIAGAVVFFPRYVSSFLEIASERRRTQFDVFTEPKGGIVFLGDSITEGGQWSEIFNRADVRNRGIAGDTTQNVLNRIEQIYILQPHKLFLMIGVNDLNQRVPTATTLANYQKLFDGFDARLPQTKIYVQSVLPVNPARPGAAKNEDIPKLNDFLKQESAKHHYTFVDLNSKFSDANGELIRSLSNDGIHLLGSGYKLWHDTLQPYIDE